MKIHIIDGAYREVIMLQSIRIGRKGLSDYPSNTQEQLKGVAVGLFVRYPLMRFFLINHPRCLVEEGFEPS